MPLLKDLLRKNTEKSGPPAPPGLSLLSSKKGSDTASQSGSVHSVRSVAGSIASFFTARGVGGERIPKRRRPDASRLGAPVFYHRVADVPLSVIPQAGTEVVRTGEGYTIAHGKSWMPPDGSPAWFSVVLWNHGEAGNKSPVYHPGSRIQGQARVHLTKPTALDFVSISLTGLTTTKFGQMTDHPANQGPFLTSNLVLWSREDGDPTHLDGKKFKGKVPFGTYAFPFEFEPWPQDMIISQPGNNVTKPKYTRLPLPPSYSFAANPSWIDDVRYTFTLNIMETARITLPTRLSFPLTYIPRYRPIIADSIPPFPYFPTREDWPFTREELGGWTITPFGGRGRFGQTMEMIEVEGLMGVPSPAVVSPGDQVRFVVILWSKSKDAVEKLNGEVRWARAVTSTLDALSPHSTAARRNRQTRAEGEGRIWRVGEEEKVERIDTEDVVSAAEVIKLNALSLSNTNSTSEPSKAKQALSPLAQSGVSVDVQDDSDDPNARAPSPTPSFEETLAEEEIVKDQGTTIRLEGCMNVPTSAVPPSFRWRFFSLEYLIHLTFTHPEYSHISPRALGIVAESPVWVVSDPATSIVPDVSNAVDLGAVPKTGGAIPLGAKPVMLPKRTAKFELAQPGPKTTGGAVDYM